MVKSGRAASTKRRSGRGSSAAARVLQWCILPVLTSGLVAVVFSNEEQISRPVADQFLRSYYERARISPTESWALLDTQYATSRNLQFDLYRGFFERLGEVVVVNVQANERANSFDATIDYKSKAGMPAGVDRLTFELRCAWMESHFPLVGCEADDLVIYDTYRRDDDSIAH